MTAVLELRGLCKSFGALAVTRDVWLSLPPNELHALIGPNGAGKTSLIGQITGTLAPDAGEVHLCGRNITHLPGHRRARLGLARSFQVTALVGGFSALENVALSVQGRSRHSLRPFGRAANEAALNDPARAALRTVGLADRAHVPAAELAHGEQRLLELACALAGEPRCLVLDEPLAGMGLAEAGKVVDLLRQLKARFTILLVEHDLDAVFALADRISVLIGGRIAATDEPAHIRADPVLRAAYLGDALE
ncbi:MAG TPA: ABC transporter ATP-binding protein [Acetobacteraceae bacterium]|nr:ABC transporter ATP-binding protein [Acetobacteraceae bacterium]